MTKNELIDLGERYCEKIRPSSYVTEVDENANTFTTYFCGAKLTHDAEKALVELNALDNKIEEIKGDKGSKIA